MIILRNWISEFYNLKDIDLLCATCGVMSEMIFKILIYIKQDRSYRHWFHLDDHKVAVDHGGS